MTPRGNPAAGPAYRSTCSAAPPGSFHFLIYGLASNSRSRIFQVNKLFPLGCLPLFARSCYYRPPQPTQTSVCQAAVQTTQLCSHDINHLKLLRVKEKALERFYIMSFLYLCFAALHSWLFILLKRLQIQYLALCSHFQQKCLVLAPCEN